MNTSTNRFFKAELPTDNDVTGSASQIPCFHCGLDVADDTQFAVEIDGVRQPMCCVGCESVAQTIMSAGLRDFYRHRVGYSEKLDPRTSPLENSERVASLAESNTSAIAATRSVRDVKSIELHLYLTGLRCAACVWLAERALGRLQGIKLIAVNLTTQSAFIRYDANAISTPEIIGELIRVGFDAEPAEHEARLVARKHTRRKQLLEFGVAALCMMQVMMLVVPIYLADPSDVSFEAKQLMSWAAWLLTLPVLLFSARPIFLSAFRTVSQTVGSGYFGMDVPVALALVLTFVTSTIALVTQSGQHYFDAITMFVFLLLGARWLESSIRLRTAESIDRLANARPLTCERLPDYPTNELAVTIRADKLQIGDVISIRPGRCVPADALVVRGATEIDEALMTGESKPVLRIVGDTLIGGTFNVHSPLIARVTAVGDKTLLSRLGQMIESSLINRPVLHGLAERTARWISPITLLLSAMAAIIWWQHDASRAVEVAIAVLAITCPCAFALSAPAALASALSRLTQIGLLVARGSLIETMATCTDLVFDKTGTLTTGKMRVTAVSCNSDQLARTLNIAVAMERGAIHPAANAINAYAADYFSKVGMSEPAAAIPVASALTSIAGQGIEANVDGRAYRLGKPDFAVPFEQRARLATASPSSEETQIALCGVDGIEPMTFAMFSMADPLRANALACIRRLQSNGVNVHLLSGDAPEVVASCATRVGIAVENVRASQTPEQKQAYVAALVGRGACVIAIGDGVNDAPMLATASGSIGLAEGATLTRISVDAVLAANRERLLGTLADAFDTARKTNRIIRQNLIWALIYNIVAVPLAMAGLVTPLIAAFGMALSSLIVVINASRLMRAPQRSHIQDRSNAEIHTQPDSQRHSVSSEAR